MSNPTQKLTYEELQANLNKAIYVPGIFSRSPNLTLRGVTPHGWPLVHLEQDPKYFGTLSVQGDRGNTLIEALKKQAQASTATRKKRSERR